MATGELVSNNTLTDDEIDALEEARQQVQEPLKQGLGDCEFPYFNIVADIPKSLRSFRRPSQRLPNIPVFSMVSVDLHAQEIRFSCEALWKIDVRVETVLVRWLEHTIANVEGVPHPKRRLRLSKEFAGFMFDFPEPVAHKAPRFLTLLVSIENVGPR